MKKHGKDVNEVIRLRREALAEARRENVTDSARACKKLSCDVTVQYFHKIAESVITEREIEEGTELIRLLEKAYYQKNLSSRVKTKAAAVLYYISKRSNKKFSQRKAAAIVGCSAVSLRKYYHFLLDLLKKNEGAAKDAE